MRLAFPIVALISGVVVAFAGLCSACVQPPPPPVLKSPANGSCENTTVTLQWYSSSGATSYRVYYGTSSYPTSPGTTASCCSKQISGLTPGARYYWRVRACNSGGCSYYSSQRYFYTRPNQASDPDPNDTEAGVALDADLSWTAGSGAASHDVYFGTSYSAVDNATTSSDEFKVNQPGTSYDPGTLSSNTTYYWRIDEVSSYDCTRKGTVWQFTTCSAAGQASNPDPNDTETGVALDADLNWTAGSGATSHDVYLGTSYSAVDNATTSSDEFKGNQPGTIYDPGTLSSNTTYYWRIDEKNGCGTTKGAVWQFNTCTLPGQASILSPGDGASGVCLDADLSWTAGSGASTHDVYLGTSYTAVDNATTSSDEFKVNQPGTTYDPGTLSSNTTYYWRIDEKNTCDTTKGTVWQFTTCIFPGQSTNPDPGDGASGLCLDVVLSWTVGSDANSHDVYFGTTYSDVNDANTLCDEFMGNQASSSWDTADYDSNGLDSNSTYYWRIDEVNNCCTTKGTTWQFTTCIFPGQAANPDPCDGASGVCLDVVLSWTAGSDANSHDVYFGTTYNDVNDANTSSDEFMGNQASSSWDTANYDANGLDSNSTYYWRIDEVNSCCTTKGSVWQFTTCIFPGQAANPDPCDGATGAWLGAILSWTPGSFTADTNGHDVYFGTSYSDVNDANTLDSDIFMGNQDSNSWDTANYDSNGLDPNSTYYWRIDEANSCCTTKGTTWQLTTCVLCTQASSPQVQGPTGEPNTLDSILNWVPGGLAQSHAVYLGVDSNEVDDANTSSAQYMGTIDVNSFDTRRKRGFKFANSSERLKNIGSIARMPDPSVIYVDRDAKGANDGTSWADAYTSLNSALSDASSSGKDIWVAESRYTPGSSRTSSFNLVSGVAVYGGFCGTEVAFGQRNWRRYKAVLDGDIGTGGDVSDNCYHVVRGANGAVLDGFTITGGNANGSGGYSRGGGLYMYQDDMTVANCTFSNNKANYGAGIWYVHSEVTISNCTFANNDGGIGGGLRGNGNTSSTKISNCAFVGNSGEYGGGAAISSSGAGHHADITNCTFSGNAVTERGGALYVDLLANVNVTNCILWGDSAEGGYDEIRNVATVTVAYSDVEGGWSGTGNIDTDPCFADPNDPDGSDELWMTIDDGLWIVSDSNCIDVGDPNTDANNTGEADITGYKRFVDGDANGTGLIDMGAYEYNPDPVKYERRPWTEAFGISELGRIVGVSYDPNHKAHAFISVASNGSDPYEWISALTDLHPAGDANESTAYDISDSNWIVGSIGQKAFLLKYPDDMNMQELPGLFSETDPNSVAYAVTEGIDASAPVAAGWSGGRAALWENLDSNAPSVHNLGTVAADHKSKAWSVNEYGEVVGYYYPDFGSNPTDRAFLGTKVWGLTDIGTLGQGSISRAYAINNFGQVVGQATIDANDSELRAFIYDTGRMHNLSELILRDTNDPNDPNWVVVSATSISDDGYIVGYGTSDDSNGYTRALLLIPLCPIGHWKFDEGSATMAMDSSDLGNHGLIYGAEWTTGRFGGGLDFDGDDGVYLESSAGADSPLNIYNTDVTVSAWVQVRGDGTIVARAKPFYTTYRLGVDGSKKPLIGTYKNGPGHWGLTSDEALSDGVWYHLVGVFDRTDDKGYVYVDGVEKAEGAMTIDPYPCDAATKIGCRNNTGDMAFDGKIDDVRIYPLALRPAEVKALFEGEIW